MADAEQRRDDLLQRIIREQLERVLGLVSVVSVTVEDAEDAYGDPVLHVVVVYDPDDGELEVSELVRHLRPALAERGEYRFPVMSFIAAEEAEAYAATT